jgi:hypothetical protein
VCLDINRPSHGRPSSRELVYGRPVRDCFFRFPARSRGVAVPVDFGQEHFRGSGLLICGQQFLNVDCLELPVRHRINNLRAFNTRLRVGPSFLLFLCIASVPAQTLVPARALRKLPPGICLVARGSATCPERSGVPRLIEIQKLCYTTKLYGRVVSAWDRKNDTE